MSAGWVSKDVTARCLLFQHWSVPLLLLLVVVTADCVLLALHKICCYHEKNIIAQMTVILATHLPKPHMFQRRPSSSVDWGHSCTGTALLWATEHIVDNIWPTNTCWGLEQEAWRLALVSGIYKAENCCCKTNSLVAAITKAGRSVCVFLLCLWNGLYLRSAGKDCRDYSCTWTFSADVNTELCLPLLHWQLHSIPKSQ